MQDFGPFISLTLEINYPTPCPKLEYHSLFLFLHYRYAHDLWSSGNQTLAIPRDKAYFESVSLFLFKTAYCHFTNWHKVLFDQTIVQCTSFTSSVNICLAWALFITNLRCALTIQTASVDSDRAGSILLVLNRRPKLKRSKFNPFNCHKIFCKEITKADV